jgi:transglutaminase-like putative cysteine protease
MTTTATETHYRVSHRTTYDYSSPMTDGYTVAYVIPRPTPQQLVERTTIDVDPEPDERLEHIDSFGNRVLQLGVHHAHSSLTVHAVSDVVVEPMILDGDGPPWESVAEAVTTCRGGEALTVRPFAGGLPLVHTDADRAALRNLVLASFAPGRPLIDAARAFCHDIYTEFEYDPASTDVSTPLSVVLERRRGVCQDFAHLAVTGLRELGLATRYVSGYIETSPPSGTPRLVGADASHAWCSIWVPDLGPDPSCAQVRPGLGGAQGRWVDFDPTNDRLPVHRHVTVAWGRDYGDVAPLRGVVIGPNAVQRLSVAVDVERVDPSTL